MASVSAEVRSPLDDEDDGDDSGVPVLSGLDLSMDGFGFPSESGEIGGDLADEKTILEVADFDDELDNIDASVDERTIFERASQPEENPSMDASITEMGVIDSMMSESPGKTADPSASMSVLELSDGDFDLEDPSRLVDIPNVLDIPTRTTPRRTSGPSIRRTVAGHPGISAKLEKLRPTSRNPALRQLLNPRVGPPKTHKGMQTLTTNQRIQCVSTSYHLGNR